MPSKFVPADLDFLRLKISISLALQFPSASHVRLNDLFSELLRTREYTKSSKTKLQMSGTPQLPGCALACTSAEMLCCDPN